MAPDSGRSGRGRGGGNRGGGGGGRGGRGGGGGGGGGGRHNNGNSEQNIAATVGDRELHGTGQTRVDNAKKISKTIDMKKYEKMISAANDNFSDIKMTSDVREDCTICVKPCDVFGVGECRHAICVECAVRMRVLDGNSNCPQCRAEIDTLFFVFASSGLATVKLDFKPTGHPDEQRYKILFENESAGVRYEKYLAHVCRSCKHGEERLEFPSFMSLRQHMANVHRMSYCHICTDNLSLFSRERRTYTSEQLQRHIRCGDPDDKSQKGHPKCLFCDSRFFDEEGRYKHLRKEHFFCQFCEADGINNVFYNKHEELVAHYGERHFLCEAPECKEAGIAFANQVDMQIHKAKEHPEGTRGGKSLALDFQFSDRQLSGPSRRQDRREREQQQAAAAQQQAALQQQQQQREREQSSFVVVPSAQHRSSTFSIRYGSHPAPFSVNAGAGGPPAAGGAGPAPADDFPSLAPSSSRSVASAASAAAPRVVQPQDFPGLPKAQPKQKANIAPIKPKAKKEPAKSQQEAYPSLGGRGGGGGGGGRPQGNWQGGRPQLDEEELREREAFRGGMDDYVSRGPAVQSSRVGLISSVSSSSSAPSCPSAPLPHQLHENAAFPTLPQPGASQRVVPKSYTSNKTTMAKVVLTGQVPPGGKKDKKAPPPKSRHACFDDSFPASRPAAPARSAEEEQWNDIPEKNPKKNKKKKAANQNEKRVVSLADIGRIVAPSPPGSEDEGDGEEREATPPPPPKAVAEEKKASKQQQTQGAKKEQQSKQPAQQQPAKKAAPTPAPAREDPTTARAHASGGGGSMGGSLIGSLTSMLSSFSLSSWSQSAPAPAQQNTPRVEPRSPASVYSTPQARPPPQSPSVYASPAASPNMDGPPPGFENVKPCGPTSFRDVPMLSAADVARKAAPKKSADEEDGWVTTAPVKNNKKKGKK